jgi:alanine dehydrogenase
MLFSTANGAPLAILQDGYLQHVRVGACAGLGVKYLAREESKTLGILGSGGMSRTYLEAILAVRHVKEVKVYSPTVAHREAYAAEMKEKTGLSVIPVKSVEEAVTNSDIVATCTDSTNEVVTNPAWIRAGMHLTNLRGPREWSPDIFARADLVFRTGPFWDAWGFNGLPAFIRNVVGQPHEISRIHEWAAFFSKRETLHDELYKKRNPSHLVDVISGKISGRGNSDQVTFFTPHGLSGLQFAAVAGTVYRLAADRGLGVNLPDNLFLQDIRD